MSENKSARASTSCQDSVQRSQLQLQLFSLCSAVIDSDYGPLSVLTATKYIASHCVKVPVTIIFTAATCPYMCWRAPCVHGLYQIRTRTCTCTLYVIYVRVRTRARTCKA